VLDAKECSGMDESGATTSTAPVTAIVNARSGRGHDAAWVHQLTEMFATHGIAVRVVLAADGTAIADALQSAMKGKPGTLIAGGGDGTINSIATHLVDTDIRLGVLPLGTLNHFARDLKIPLALDQAVRTIVAAHTTRVDVGEVNGQVFLNNSSIGMYALMVQERDRERRSGLGKWPALIKASWKILSVHRSRKMHLVVDGRALERRTPLVFVGNNAYVLSGFEIGERKQLDGGVLSLYIVPRDQRFNLVWLAIRSLFGHLHQDRDFQAMTAEDIVINAGRSHMHVATDGEVEELALPLHYRIRKRALCVIVPEKSS
jgi:YegS/Rv2252/BmrU family lipid kinase